MLQLAPHFHWIMHWFALSIAHLLTKTATDVVETDVTQTVDNANSKEAAIVLTAGKTKSCQTSAQVKALEELSISFQPARASSANIPCLPRTTGKTAWTR